MFGLRVGSVVSTCLACESLWVHPSTSKNTEKKKKKGLVQVAERLPAQHA
jgi:hypothetical protein